jgi:hypothetical protein
MRFASAPQDDGGFVTASRKNVIRRDIGYG